MYPLQVHFFRNAIQGPDQLRQRVAWALSQMLVTSGLDVTLSSWMQPYQQLLYQSAFGNYRQLLYDVTRSAAMGRYLDVVNNQCQTRTPADVDVCRTGAAVKPNENYARELLQLFSIGVDLLNADGSPVRDDGGRPIAAYLRTRSRSFLACSPAGFWRHSSVLAFRTTRIRCGPAKAGTIADPRPY